MRADITVCGKVRLILRRSFWLVPLSTVESEKQRFRLTYFTFFYYGKVKMLFKQGKIPNAYGEGVLRVHQCPNWFANFRSGNFDVENAPLPRRPVKDDKHTINALVNNKNSPVPDHLKQLCLTPKLGVWVHQVLRARNL